MTETAGVIASQGPDSPPNCVGRPVGVEVTIRDASLAEVQGPGIGEVVLRGAQVSQGYLDAPEDQSFVDGWFRTGDLGYIDA